MAVHYQSSQAVTLEVASEDANTSLAEPNWGAVAEPEILNLLLFQVEKRFPGVGFSVISSFSPWKDTYEFITEPTSYEMNNYQNTVYMQTKTTHMQDCWNT